MPIGLKGNTDGSGAVQIGGSDAITISTGLNTTFAGTVTATGTVAGATGTLYPLTSGTAVAFTSGTAIDFTGIPSWVKRITVMFSGVSTNGTSNIQVQVGTSGSITTSGYVGAVSNQAGTAANNSTGLQVANTVTAADIYWGHIVLTKTGANATQVSETSILANSNAANARYSAGAVTPANPIDTVRITTVNGTDTFDAGSINILFE
jgi:hypothetical protein